MTEPHTLTKMSALKRTKMHGFTFLIIMSPLQINRSYSSDDNHMGYQLCGVVDEVEAGQ